MEEIKVAYIRKTKKEKGCYVDKHLHNDTELVFYLKGNGKSLIGDKVYEFSEKTLAVINKDTRHDELHYSDADVIFMVFSFPHFQIPNGIYKPRNFAVLEQIIQQIYVETNSPKYKFEYFLAVKVSELMIQIMREMLNYESDERLEDCMYYLTQNCSKDINMQKVAQKYNIGYENFRHKFKKLYGMSPKKFVVTKRLMKASDMLIETDLSCTDIAYECGFADSMQFSKLFKKQFGMSPLKFRGSIK